MKKVAVLGSTGMAGHVIATYLEEKEYVIYNTSRSAANNKNSASIDACNIEELEKWLDKVDPDYVINCIGVLQNDSDQRPDKAILLNAFLPQKLAFKYKNSQTKVIHLSTDCVFSGATGGYTEDSTQDGTTIYDRSKALGEIRNCKDLTFRMSIIGPDINENGGGLFNWFMKQSGKINGYTKAVWNGVTTIELARAIDSAIKCDLRGLYHLTPQTPILKYDLLSLIGDVFDRDDIQIEPYDAFVVDKTLVNTRTDFDFIISSYPEMVVDMKKWVDAHRDLYGYRY